MVSREQVDRIREDSRKGMTANQIQKDLQAHHMGMRRKTILGIIREERGKPKRGEEWRYIPTKYQYRILADLPEVKKERMKRTGLFGKQIAVYGTVDGKSRRVQLTGTGKDLYRAMLDVAKFPPKKRFLTAGAGDVHRHLDFDDRWDKHPKVESQ